MQQGFPSEDMLGALPARVVVLHAVMAGLLISAVVGLFVAGRGKAKRGEVFYWLTLALLTPIAASFVVGQQPSYARGETAPFIAGYVLLVWFMAWIGMVLNHRRLVEQQQGSPFWWVCISLFFLGIVITLSLPQTPAAREAARRSQCRNNLKQIALALHNYADVTSGMFPAAATGTPAVSWRVTVLPFLNTVNGVELRRRYQLDLAWDDAANEPIAQTANSELTCPSNPSGMDDRERYYTAYVMPTGAGTISPDVQGTYRDDIPDGTANTMLVVEACGLEIVWTEPRDIDVTQQPVHINLKGQGKTDSPGLMSSYHLNGAHATFVDGSVRFISQNIDPNVLRAMTTMNGGEPLPAD